MQKVTSEENSSSTINFTAHATMDDPEAKDASKEKRTSNGGLSISLKDVPVDDNLSDSGIEQATVS